MEKETKSKIMLACLKPEVDNIVLIKQYRVGHGFNKPQQYQHTYIKLDVLQI